MIAIGFSTTDKLLSRLIRWKTSIPELKPEETPSHVWILHDAYGSEYVMQAEWYGFGVISFEHFKKTNRVIDVISVSDMLAWRNVDARARVFEAAEWLGDGYDFWHMLGFVLPALAHGDSPKQLMCSEAVVRFAPELFPGVNPERASPPRMLHTLRNLAAATPAR